MAMKRAAVWLVYCLMMIAGVSTTASAQTTCPANVLLALSRAGSTCFDLAFNHACYGNGSAEAGFFDADGDLSFGAPGDRVPIASLSALATHTMEDGFSVVPVKVQANLADSEQRNTAILLFGEALAVNDVPPLATFVITANGTISIRDQPMITADIVARMGLGDNVTVNGRTPEGDWLRVRIPNRNDLGWIAADVAPANSPLDALAIVTPETPFYRPFQVIEVATGSGDALCDGAPESGILIQTPNTRTEVTLILNGASLTLSATVYVQNQPDGQLAFTVIDGQMAIALGETARFVPAGSRLMAPLDSDGMIAGLPDAAAPYNTAELAALPINNLPDRVQVAPALTQTELELAIADWQTAALEQDEEDLPTREEVCRYETNQRATIWGGPGLFYEAINEISSGTRLNPVLETTDADGNIWWQLDTTNWIRGAVVTATGGCEPIPIVQQVPPPRTNTLTMETCESDNGPIRVGQVVTLEFLPAPFENYEAAMAATSVDPGRITANEQPLYVSPGPPIRRRSGEEDIFFRTFSAVWLAESGTTRIVARRLSYILTCDVTVPF